MDKVSKSIRNLDSKTAKKITKTMELLFKNKIEFLDIKKLRGYRDIFRIKTGNYRIIYKKGRKIKILFIGHRDEKTYKNF
jgi:mRNA-degrading endonuclease RelE of RelBE toxin-antitoxin system